MAVYLGLTSLVKEATNGLVPNSNKPPFVTRVRILGLNLFIMGTVKDWRSFGSNLLVDLTI